jgi:hypothetical protein
LNREKLGTHSSDFELCHVWNSGNDAHIISAPHGL